VIERIIACLCIFCAYFSAFLAKKRAYICAYFLHFSVHIIRALCITLTIQSSKNILTPVVKLDCYKYEKVKKSIYVKFYIGIDYRI
jgi:hypothetical protein